jgi:hypothetical protein
MLYRCAGSRGSRIFGIYVFSFSTPDNVLNTYLLFCEHFNRLAFPIDQETLCGYACFLAEHFKSSGSVRNYLSGIKTWTVLLKFDTGHKTQSSIRLSGIWWILLCFCLVLDHWILIINPSCVNWKSPLVNCSFGLKVLDQELLRIWRHSLIHISYFVNILTDWPFQSTKRHFVDMHVFLTEHFKSSGSVRNHLSIFS